MKYFSFFSSLFFWYKITILITSCDRLISLFWRNCLRLTIPTFFNSISWKREEENSETKCQYFENIIIHEIIKTHNLISSSFVIIPSFSLFHCSLYCRKHALLFLSFHSFPLPFVVIERWRRIPKMTFGWLALLYSTTG